MTLSPAFHDAWSDEITVPAKSMPATRGKRLPTGDWPGSAAHARRLAGAREAILVVDRRPLHRNGDIALHKVGIGQLRDGDGLLLVLIARHQDGLESIGHVSSFGRGRSPMHSGGQSAEG